MAVTVDEALEALRAECPRRATSEAHENHYVHYLHGGLILCAAPELSMQLATLVYGRLPRTFAQLAYDLARRRESARD